jgi:hypothetical protein
MGRLADSSLGTLGRSPYPLGECPANTHRPFNERDGPGPLHQARAVLSLVASPVPARTLYRTAIRGTDGLLEPCG